MSSSVNDEDYLDRLSRVIPWHRTFTFYERLFIIILVATFISIVGCIFLFLIYSRSRLRKRYVSQKNLDKEHCMENVLVFSEPPSYESAVRTSNSMALNKSNKNHFSKSSRQSSYGTASESDGTHTHNNGFLLTNSTHSITANASYPSFPFAQIHVEFSFDPMKNLLHIHVLNGEYISLHSTFDDQAEFFIHIQLLNNKILKKFQEIQNKHRSNLQLTTWKKQQEKTTKKLSRTADDKLTCDEYLSFELHKDDAKTSSLRFLLFCIDRSGVQDVMFESIIRLNSSITEPDQKLVELKDLPQITFGEIYLGISYLPTAQRFMIKMNKLHYLFKTDKDEKIDARLIVSFFHHGHRFYHKKFTSLIFDGASTTNNNLNEINETITQNIPQKDIQSIHVHFELIVHLSRTNDQSIISCGTFLLGEQTRYESDWQKMFEQPRQIHFGWYQFFG
ncbi:hypothetical protein I4U23_007392 [Adineta vaga]|nr:hypothetical protein I4U23_007392 [Adineta vaga]